ncbi:MAG TPA: MlaD family protein [Solirubrobacterales bacterium]|jgi:ABC-type transporter Mla subunit MlaD|nr:MlaD family protein [Solirubrobacterales bacterium]
MSKRAPSTGQLLVIAGFALSCFGILLFLWVTFGGPTPFRAKPYEIKVPFNEATQLAEQSDVRISGVNVGKVRNIALADNGKQALATVDIDDKYAPLPESTRAILRTKTLLGETYIELTPGAGTGPELADGGSVPEANVAESVQLDEIFRTFDPETRAAFQSWMQEAAVAINGQGQGLSYAIGEFEPTFTDLDKLFRVLDTQRVAVGQLFRNGATSLQALRGREGQLASLIQSSNAVFQTAARRDRDIEALFRAFPTFQDESRLTLNRLKAFAVNTDPLMRQLVPAAKQLSPTLVAFANLAPEAKGFFEGLSIVIGEAPTGFPALRKLFRDDFPPLLRAVDPFLRNLNPLLTGLNLYKHEVTSVFANLAATFAGELPVENAKGEKLNYLRAMSPITAETLSTYPSRLVTNRNSAYSPPKWAEGLVAGLPSFNTRQCTSGLSASLDSNTPNETAFKERTKKGETKEAEEFFNNLKKYAFAEGSGTSSSLAPSCAQQPPLNPIYGGGPATTYQHTFEQTGE